MTVYVSPENTDQLETRKQNSTFYEATMYSEIMFKLEIVEHFQKFISSMCM